MCGVNVCVRASVFVFGCVYVCGRCEVEMLVCACLCLCVGNECLCVFVCLVCHLFASVETFTVLLVWRTFIVEDVALAISVPFFLQG